MIEFLGGLLAIAWGGWLIHRQHVRVCPYCGHQGADPKHFPLCPWCGRDRTS